MAELELLTGVESKRGGSGIFRWLVQGIQHLVKGRTSKGRQRHYQLECSVGQGEMLAPVAQN